MLEQPALESLIQRMSHELAAKALVVLHENGQVLYRYGWIEENEHLHMAALVAAMIAAGKSLGQLGENFPGNPSRFGYDSESRGLYTVAVTSEIWLAVLYDQPLNPGKFRMKVRGYAELISKLGVQQPQQWEVPQSDTSPRATLPPVSSVKGTSSEILTSAKSSLFADISDDEIDKLFENARS